MSTLLSELKERRLSLGLKQKDMYLRAGMSRQQYQRLESKGNPSLDTLELISKSLNLELMLIPSEKLNAVKRLLSDTSNEAATITRLANTTPELIKENTQHDPWEGIFDEDIESDQ